MQEGVTVKLLSEAGNKSKWLVVKLIGDQQTLEVQKINKSDPSPQNGSTLTLLGTKTTTRAIAKDRLAELALLLIKQ